MLFILLEVASAFLLHLKVRRTDDDAVGRNLVAGVENDDITNNEAPDVDRLHSTELATDDGDLLITSVFSKLDELAVFEPVVPAGNNDQKEEGEKDADSLNPACSPVLNHACD